MIGLPSVGAAEWDPAGAAVGAAEGAAEAAADAVGSAEADVAAEAEAAADVAGRAIVVTWGCVGATTEGVVGTSTVGGVAPASVASGSAFLQPITQLAATIVKMAILAFIRRPSLTFAEDSTRIGHASHWVWTRLGVDLNRGQ